MQMQYYWELRAHAGVWYVTLATTGIMVVTVVVSIVQLCMSSTQQLTIHKIIVNMVSFHNHIAWLLFMHNSFLVRWSKHDVIANTIDVDIHGQLFVATDAERSDCVHLLLGALQR